MTDAAETTAQLVERARAPDLPLEQQHAAFTQLVERSQRPAFAVALRALRDASEAEDAAQEAFLSAWLRLPQLRDPSAFTPWLKTIVATQCKRRLGRRSHIPPRLELAVAAEAGASGAAYKSLVAPAVASLPAGERQVTVLFYFLGHTLREISGLLGLKPGTVGKRLYSARLRIRRRLPPSVRGEFVRLAPSRTFVEKVRLGLFDEYVGEYRFAQRPDLVVRITREGDSLVSDGGGQRCILASLSGESLVTDAYDGEGRFRRNRRGRVTHFVYYEFGKRLGIARKTVSRPDPRQPLGES